MAEAPKIIDAHTHFFSYNWLEHFYHLAQDRFENVAALAAHLGWEMPPKDPAELGKRWVSEQDKYGVAKQILFASKLNDAESVAAAINAFPNRLVGYVMIDPNMQKARWQTQYAINILGMRGVLMFPAMHHFHAYDEAAYVIYEEAFSAEAPVFLHFGKLSIPIFQRIGLPDNVKPEYSNPLDLRQVASDFRDVNFIIPHFGCGRFDEALEVASANRNVYLDTSSSNSWIEPPLTLKDVFAKTLQEIGPGRLLFGTDSSTFPRGWRKDIFETQKAILDELGVAHAEQKLILGGNIARILKLN